MVPPVAVWSVLLHKLESGSFTGGRDLELYLDERANVLAMLRDLGTDPVLGTYQIRLDDMLQLMGKGQEWYNLAGAKTGRAKMMLQWKPVALKGAPTYQPNAADRETAWCISSPNTQRKHEP